MLFDNIVTPMITTTRKREKIIEYSLLFTNINTKNVNRYFARLRDRVFVFSVSMVFAELLQHIFPSKHTGSNLRCIKNIMIFCIIYQMSVSKIHDILDIYEIVQMI